LKGTTEIKKSDSCSGSQTYNLAADAALAPNTWYSLEIKGSGAVEEKVYPNPIKIWTVSTSTTNFIVYDENLSAGIVAISEEVTTLKNL
jgi:hypothetical protein